MLLKAKRNKNEKITKGVGVAALAGAAVLGGSMALQNHDNKMAEKYNRKISDAYSDGLDNGHRIEREHQERLQRIKNKNKKIIIGGTLIKYHLLLFNRLNHHKLL